MDSGFLRHWPIYCLIAAAGLSALVLKMAMGTSVVVGTHSEDQSYEMLRPKSNPNPYDLSGRHVVRSVHSKVNQSGPPQLPPSPVAPAPSHAKIQTPNAKAQVEANARAKAKAEADARAKVAKARELKKKQEEEKARAMAQNNSGLGKTSGSGETNEIKSNPDAQPAVAAATPEQNDQTPVDHSGGVEKQKLSPAQWRSLMHGQPTLKNAQAFISAFHSGEVDAATFYQVAQDLLSDSATDRQEIALFLVRQENSVKAFTFLVSNYKEQTPEPLKSKVYDVLKTYKEASKFAALNNALVSSDARSVQMATDLLSQVVAAQTAVKTEASGREIRTPGSAPVAVSNFQTFLPNLRRLASSPDASIAEKAKTLLASIEAMKPV